MLPYAFIPAILTKIMQTNKQTNGVFVYSKQHLC